MVKRIITVASVCIILAMSAPFFARLSVADDGRDYLEICESGDPDDKMAVLVGGMAFGLLTGQNLGGPARRFCPPNDGRLSNGQYRLVVCRYLKNNHQVLTQEGYLALGISLLNSYPCPAVDQQ